MSIVDHGAWVPYQPATTEGHPSGAIFARRESDGWDWYDYTRHETSPFVSPGTVKFAAMLRPEGYVVGPAVYDPSMIFPAGHIVAEITDYTGNDPQADFGNKIYDPATQTFTPFPPPAADPLLMALNEIRARLDALEKKGP